MAGSTSMSDQPWESSPTESCLENARRRGINLGVPGVRNAYLDVLESS
jgi:hypothetical protein